MKCFAPGLEYYSWSASLSGKNMARIAIFFILVGLTAPGVLAQDRGRLVVAENSRYLQYQDGTPFFYLGDTAWELFHRLTRDEADRYLADRAEKGFTVIQAVVLAPQDGLTTPNAYGDLPLTDMNPARPNEAYFRHVDYIVNKANEHGLFVGLLPTWGRYWKRVGLQGPFAFTPENAEIYGRYVGERYREASIIWILGGDENIESEEERSIIEALASGLEKGDDGAHLMSYHPRGPGLSSDYFHSAAWLDFNMVQSSHAAHDHDNGLFTAHDYALDPPKPTLDGEPRYECLPVGFYFRDINRFDRFDDDDVRQAAYWSLLAGACGFTYGHNSIWQMWAPGLPAVLWADIPWSEALDHPGAFQMGFVRRLFESRPFLMLEPCPSMILDGPPSGGGKIRALRAHDGSFAFIYTPRGEKFTVNKSLIRAVRVREIWYNPRYGVAHHVHTSDNAGFQTYTPPTAGSGDDWIFILEDAAAEYPLP